MPPILPSMRLPRRTLALALLAALLAAGGLWLTLRRPVHQELGCPPLTLSELVFPPCPASPLPDRTVSEQGSLMKTTGYCTEIADLIDQLELKAQRTKRPPAVLRDLAAAYCIAGRRDVRPDQLARGLEHWLEAAEKDGRAEPRWTDEALGMCEEVGVLCGRTAGQTRPAQNPPGNPTWPALAALAARDAKAEAEALVRGNASAAADELLFQGLLPATPTSDGDLAKTRRWVVDRLTRITGDTLWQQGLEGLERAEKAPDGEAARALLAALAEIREVKLGSAERLDAAAAELQRLGSPLWIHAEILAAKARFLASDRRQAVDRLLLVLQQPELATHGWNRGRIHLTLGTNLTLLGQLEAALVHSESALETLARTPDRVTVWRGYNNLNDAQTYLGREAQAWRFAAKTLKLVRAQPPSQLGITVETVASQALRAGLPRLAHQLQREALGLSSPDELSRVHTLAQAALIEVELGDHEGARVRIEQAKGLLARAPSASSVDEARIRALEAESAWFESAEPARAQALLETAIELAAAREQAPVELRLRVKLAELARRLGQEQVAERSLGKAAAQVEAMLAAALAQKGAGGESLKTFVQLHRPTFERLLVLQLARDEDASALRTAEQMRTREVLGLLARSLSLPASALTPPPVSEIQAGLDPGTTLLSFAVLPNETFVWIVRRGSLEVARLELGRRELRHAVDRLVRSTVRGGTELDRELRALHKALITPLLDRLGGTRHLGIVPDDALNAVPFAALLDPATGHYRVETWTTASSPSLALGAFARERAQQLGAMPIEKVLLVAEPALDPAIHPDLPPLVASRQETAALATIYPEATVLGGADATRSAVTALLPQCQLLHFSGHSVTSPNRSYLALAGNRIDEAQLDAQGLLGLDLSRVHLAVLASCTSLGDRLNGAEGTHSLARPLLGAGVPGVVASLWEVPDTQTAALMPDLHRAFRRGDTAAEALRQAQLQRLRSDDPSARDPRAWGGFVLVGWAEASSPP
jgi:CHAT domain-containing protein